MVAFILLTGNWCRFALHPLWNGEILTETQAEMACWPAHNQFNNHNSHQRDGCITFKDCSMLSSMQSENVAFPYISIGRGQG